MLEIRHLSKRFGPSSSATAVQAINDVSLAVARGKIVGFVGPNGAGKSTTMRSIFGLVEPDAGSITWDGQRVTPEVSAGFGYMPEQRGLYPKMRIAEQVSFFAQLKMVPRNRADESAERLLTTLGLGDRLGDHLEKLSHGNQQRVQLAVALANDPDLLVLDEPFNGLDPVAVKTLQDVLAERVEAGAGILFSSHQLELVERICDEVVLIAGGEIRAAGTVKQVRSLVGTRVLDIEVDRPLMPLIDALGSVRTVRHDTSSATIVVDSEQELRTMLAAAEQAGAVTRFNFDMPSLSDVFAEIVGDPIDAEEVVA